MGLSDIYYFCFNIDELRAIESRALHFANLNKNSHFNFNKNYSESKKKAHLELANACKELDKILTIEKKEKKEEEKKRKKNKSSGTIPLVMRRKY